MRTGGIYNWESARTAPLAAVGGAAPSLRLGQFIGQPSGMSVEEAQYSHSTFNSTIRSPDLVLGNNILNRK
ncbi:hypothetical protein PG990_012075 [Apiospora arundinis]